MAPWFDVRLIETEGNAPRLEVMTSGTMSIAPSVTNLVRIEAEPW